MDKILENKRLAELERFEILDTPSDGAFDNISALAAYILKTPIAIVSLVDKNRIWFKSHHGLEVNQIDREPGLCSSAIMDDSAYIVRDAKVDPRTLSNSLVAGEFGLQFYAGVPLKTSTNCNLGTLCVIDFEPREITQEEIDLLEKMAKLVMDQMELRLASRKISDLHQELMHETHEKEKEHKEKISSQNKLNESQIALVREEKKSALNSMITGICHHINTPLSNLSLSLELTRENTNKLMNNTSVREGKVAFRKSDHDALNGSMEISSRAEEQIRAIIDRTKFLNPQELSIVADNIKFEEVVKFSLAYLRQHRVSPINLIKNYKSDISLLTSPYILATALSILFENVIDHAFTDQREVSISISIQSRANGEFAIQIEDFGVGIPETQSNQIFDPFFSGELCREHHGLGLAICKTMLEELLGASITLLNKESSGCLFEIILPPTSDMY
ncbi:GAF domain-containing sensor histidine kinase [Vibrio penaeicida]|uniref:GAF domain-containing sensor histidine kinase n=1 Tax=Vibrio penaeicida TaxID=104609 RepID=UPI0027375A07|nr:GAF domain-containing sensor histidine kinase [Vibrio penaeicida]MDP2574306.1 GAF domain-containing sensor histidine kinase [Vibrio penaeicida]